jgi:hypothetical protein
VAFCRPAPDKQLKAKHVESDFADCLDPGSTPGSSTDLNKTVHLFQMRGFVLLTSAVARRSLSRQNVVKEGTTGSSTSRKKPETHLDFWLFYM